GVQLFGALLRRHRPRTDAALDDPYVEADLLLQRFDLSPSRPTEVTRRMVHQCVVDAADESRKADDALQIDLEDVEGRRIRSVLLAQFEGELVGERRLAGVPRPEERYVRLRLQSQGHVMREPLHPNDLGRVIERAVPDERIEGAGHGPIVSRPEQVCCRKRYNLACGAW